MHNRIPPNKMTSKEINILETRFSFTVSENDFKNEIRTREVVVADVPWKLKLCKQSTRGGDIIKIGLMCLTPERLSKPDWSCEATATVSLRSFDFNQCNVMEKRIPQTVYHQDCNSSLIEFIKLADLKPFEINKRFYFAAQISANPIKYHKPLEIKQTAIKFQIDVENVSELQLKNSLVVTVRQMDWYVSVESDKKSLSIFLCNKRKFEDIEWSWKADVTFKLLSFNKNIEPITKSMTHTYYHDAPGRGFADFVSWDELMDSEKKYVNNDRATFEIDLNVSPPRPVWEVPKALQKSILDCSICCQNIVERTPTATKCGHLFCKACIKRSIEENKRCPMCNTSTSLSDTIPIYP